MATAKVTGAESLFAEEGREREILRSSSSIAGALSGGEKKPPVSAQIADRCRGMK